MMKSLKCCWMGGPGSGNGLPISTSVQQRVRFMTEPTSCTFISFSFCSSKLAQSPAYVLLLRFFADRWKKTRDFPLNTIDSHCFQYGSIYCSLKRDIKLQRCKDSAEDQFKLYSSKNSLLCPCRRPLEIKLKYRSSRKPWTNSFVNFLKQSSLSWFVWSSKRAKLMNVPNKWNGLYVEYMQQGYSAEPLL